MNADVFTSNELSNLDYKTLLILAKKYNLLKKRAKKALLIKKLVGLPKKEDDLLGFKENLDPSEHKDESMSTFRMESMKDVSAETSFADITPFPAKADESKCGDSLSENNETFVTIGEADFAEIEMDNSRRSTFTVDTSGLPIAPKNTQTEQNDRRLTFVKTESTCPFRDIRRTRGSSIKPEPRALTKSQKTEEIGDVKQHTTKLGRAPTKNPVSSNLLRAVTPKVKSYNKPEMGSALSAKRIDRTFTSAKKTPLTDSKRTLTESGRKPGMLPNFRAIHEKQFSKMESLWENRARVNRRLPELFSPQPKNNVAVPALNKESKIPLLKEKLNVSVNRRLDDTFSLKTSAIPVATRSRRENLKSSVMSKLHGTTMEKTRDKGRTVIAGVRSNRRFELQMKMRNITNVL